MTKISNIKELEKKVIELKKEIVRLTCIVGGTHIGGCLSALDVLVALYYSILNLDHKNPKWNDRDIFILSKGHAGFALCVILADLGYFPKEELETFNQSGSRFGIHPDRNKIPGIEVSTGSLGHGLPISLGIALADQMDKKQRKIICMIGDGEIHEGSNWEAIMAASHYKLSNLVCIVDYNKLCMDGFVNEIINIEPLIDRFESFGWYTKEIDGHNMKEIIDTFYDLPINKGDKPIALICHTVKGKGIKEIENNVGWHYGTFDEEKECKIMEELDRCLAELS